MAKPTVKKATPQREPAAKTAPRKTRVASDQAEEAKPEAVVKTRKKKTAVSADIRAHVATTLASWMEADPQLDTQVKVAKASRVTQTTVSRILNGTTAATADVLDAIARAFGRDAGDLLTSHAEAKIDYDPKRFARLPDYEKARIEAFIKHVLKEHELPTTDEPKKKTSR